MSAREFCSLCGRGIQPYDAYYTDEGPIHLGCQTLTSGPSSARTRGRDGRSPDYQAPSLAQQEYVRQTSRCYATLFHDPDRRSRTRPRYRR